MSGYNIQWKSPNSDANKINVASNITTQPSANRQNLSASINDNPQELSITSHFPELNMINPQKDTCDTIVLKNGTQMLAKVWEVLKDTVVYQKCGDKSEVPNFISRSEVDLIKYVDGSKVNMEEKKRQEDSLAKITMHQDSLKLTVAHAVKDSCDTIIMSDGSQLLALVVEVSEGAVEYKECANIKGPSHYISRTKTRLIKYTNGTSELVEEKKPVIPTDVPEKTEPTISKGNLGGFIGSILGFLLVVLTGTPIPGVPFWIGMLLAVTGAIFGADALGKIDKYPELWKGTKIAKVSVVLGALSFILFFIFLAKYMTF